MVHPVVGRSMWQKFFFNTRLMKKIFSVVAVIAVCLSAWAVPAKREFHVYTLGDGSSVELTLAGDEYAHWYEDASGRIYTRLTDGTFAPSGKTRSEMAQRRKASVKYRSNAAKRAKKVVGSDPNLAPRGIIILANFSDKSMASGHTQAVFDELVNSTNCTVNSGYPSAAQYFADQSNGTYRPIFDVYGPVTLSRNVAYYGKDIVGSDEGDDQHATDAVVEACILANQQYNIDFTQYDSDSDGFVDFVYVIYAGRGQADGGASNTIWPHNWDIESARYYYIDGDENGENGTVHYCTYSEAECTIDGVVLNNYACSSELSGSVLNGIGTLCHEFGHVMGLPDFYDTAYGKNYEDSRTPGSWDIMDAGSYNGDGHCPPNYSAWEKSFFGWCTPVNLGSTSQSLTLQASGTTGYQSYQVNASGNYISATTSGQCYYIENRQKSGWDSELPGHGMLVWSVNYNQSAWEGNTPNNTDRNPLYTVISASGGKTSIGSDVDPFPGTRNKTTWSTLSDKQLQNIVESNGVITCNYVVSGGQVDPPQPQDEVMTVAQALTAIAALPNTNETSEMYYVRGIISRMNNTPAQITQYKNARFYISDDGTTANELYCFGTKWLNNTNFTTGEEIKAGDTVTIYGKLQNYQGNTPEIKGYVYEVHTGGDETGVDFNRTENQPVKQIVSGELIIMVDGKKYTIFGVQR